MSINWGLTRTISLASISSLWQNRSVLLIPGLAIGAIDYLSLLDDMSSFAPALQFLSFALVITLGVFIHRGLLLDDHRLNLKWGMREVRYLLVLLAIMTSGFFVFAFIQYFSLYALAGVILPAEYPLPKDLKLSEYQAPEAIQNKLYYVVIASSIIGLAGFSWLFSRLYMLLPAAATDQFLSIAEVWNKTKEDHLPIFLIVFIPILLLLPVSYGYQFKSLVPVLLAMQFLIQVFIFTSITIAFYLSQQEPAA